MMHGRARIAWSVLWLTAKVLLVLFLMRGTFVPFLYQNF